MRKLLRANFYCLRRSKLLWLCFLGAFVLSAFFMVQLSGGDAELPSLDMAILQVFPFLPILYAAFISLFLGLDYQDGTMRNKLVIGHARGAVYLSALTTGIVGCFAILLGWFAGGMIGIVRLGWFVAPTKALLLYAAAILLLTAAEAAILTLVAMLVTNRAVSSVVSILLIFALLLLSSTLYNALCEPELAASAVATGNGFEFGAPQPNADYVSGVRRVIYQFIIDALPTGQAILLANQELARPALSLCASACIVLLTVAVGMIIFRRKDLK